MKFLITSLLITHNIVTSISTKNHESYLYSFLRKTIQPKETKQKTMMKQRTQSKNSIPNNEQLPSKIQQQPLQSNLRGTIEIPVNETKSFNFEVLYPDSLAPSSAPTMSSVIDFDYNPYSAIGPKNWGSVVKVPTTFKDFITENGNQCSSTPMNSNEHVQSPINVKHNYICGDSAPPKLSYGQTKFSELGFSIQPNALRVNFPKNNIPTPKIEFSDLSKQINLLHIDVKIKSEHYLNGVQYPGEFQMYFHFPTSADRTKQNIEDELVAMSIFMDFDDETDQDNVQLEQFIRQWEEKLWRAQNECKRKEDPSAPQYAPFYYNVYRKEEIEKIWELPKPDGNSTLRTDFNIWRFMPTGYYCGYRGSLTEPPCTDKVTWRILDLPMNMSKNQYKRMQNILMNRLDTTTCEITTAAYNATVNRPLQDEIIEENNIITGADKMFCCNAYNWPFSDENDPQYWLHSWPLDYHGWQGTTVATYKTFFDLHGGGRH